MRWSWPKTLRFRPGSPSDLPFEHCTSCEFFMRRGTKYGECHIASPIMRLRQNQSGLIVHDAYGSWPAVSQDAWCGQWTGRSCPEPVVPEEVSRTLAVRETLRKLSEEDPSS